MTPPRRSFKLISNSTVVLRPGNAIGCVKTGEHEFHARGAHGGARARIDLERFLPGPRHPPQPLGVLRGRKHVAYLDLDALAEDVDDLLEPVPVNILVEDLLEIGRASCRERVSV